MNCKAKKEPEPEDFEYFHCIQKMRKCALARVPGMWLDKAVLERLGVLPVGLDNHLCRNTASWNKEEKTIWRHRKTQGRRPYRHGHRDWCEASASQALLATARIQERSTELFLPQDLQQEPTVSAP